MLRAVSNAVTEGIRITVRTTYLADQSEPRGHRYVFAYKVKITNEGEATARLRTRHWIIKDAEGRVDEVRGEGVVGNTPTLRPGQSFEYTSHCVLKTPRGSMEGSYRMQRDDGVEFDAAIASFTLALPQTLN
jgi:ApaG protein